MRHLPSSLKTIATALWLLSVPAVAATATTQPTSIQPLVKTCPLDLVLAGVDPLFQPGRFRDVAPGSDFGSGPKKWPQYRNVPLAQLYFESGDNLFVFSRPREVGNGYHLQFTILNKDGDETRSWLKTLVLPPEISAT